MRLPAEWEPQEATWLTWPASNRHWAGKKMAAKWAEIAAQISRFQKVKINLIEELQAEAIQSLQNAKADLSVIEFFNIPSDDVWCRDHGPIFAKNECNQTVITDWEFNGWGNAFEPYSKDTKIPRAIAEQLGMGIESFTEVLEGGAIEYNGDGHLITTECVLLNPNRNPQLDRKAIEELLHERLGIHRVTWLKEGIEGDDTGGHVDDLTRFFAKESVLTAIEPIERKAQSPNYKRLKENKDILLAEGLEVVDLPMPQACEVPGWRLPILPASYANFLVINEAVLVPSFQQSKNDEHAQGVIADCFPGREIIPIDCLDLVSEGGALHCISMQQPA